MGKKEEQQEVGGEAERIGEIEHMKFLVYFSNMGGSQLWAFTNDFLNTNNHVRYSLLY